MTFSLTDVPGPEVWHWSPGPDSSPQALGDAPNARSVTLVGLGIIPLGPEGSGQTPDQSPWRRNTSLGELP
jgi:hypothetical protein